VGAGYRLKAAPRLSANTEPCRRPRASDLISPNPNQGNRFCPRTALARRARRWGYLPLPCGNSFGFPRKLRSRRERTSSRSVFLLPLGLVSMDSSLGVGVHESISIGVRLSYESFARYSFFNNCEYVSGDNNRAKARSMLLLTIIELGGNLICSSYMHNV
jgi:hypothetical protein